jgi:hypothetical protein
MGWTKKQLIMDAFAEIGLNDAFNVSADDQQLALRRMDTMLAEWNSKGIRLGYPLPSSPDASKLDDDSGLPDAAFQAVITNLAIRLAPGFGKTVSQDTRTTATAGYNTLLKVAAFPPEQQRPDTLPRGAGNKPWGGGYPRPFQPRPRDPLLAGQGDEPIDFE